MAIIPSLRKRAFGPFSGPSPPENYSPVRILGHAPSPRLRLIGPFCGPSALLSVLLLLSGPWASGEEFHFRGLDRTYSQFADELAPIELGVVKVLLKSPEHSMTLERHLVRLVPAEGDSHRVSLELDLHGSGTLDAHLQVGSLAGDLEDELVVPPQSLLIGARVEIHRVPEGFRVTLLEGPKEIEVRIESRLASRIVPLCRQMALVLVRFDCGALDEALSRVLVPVPPPGEQFLIPLEELTAAEVSQFEHYLRRAAGL